MPTAMELLRKQETNLRWFDRYVLMASAAETMKVIALSGTFDGTVPNKYLERCRAFHEPTGTLLIYTRDVGYHSSGWWKNPDYERCGHLSLSFVDPLTGQIAPRDRKRSKEWAQLFFGRHAGKAWIEPPYTKEGKAKEVHHYRLFCDPAWEPIVPRGEVYSRELTELGWLSWSDERARDEAERAAAREFLGNTLSERRV